MLGQEAIELIDRAAPGFIDEAAADQFPIAAVLEALDQFASPKHSRFLNNAIRNAIRHGQRSAWWDYEALPRAFIARPEPAPLQMGSEQQLAAAELLIDRLVHALPNLMGCAPSNPPEANEADAEDPEHGLESPTSPTEKGNPEPPPYLTQLGALIVSAALLGGIFETKLLNAVPGGLLDAVRRTRLPRAPNLKERVPEPVEELPRLLHVEVELRIKDDERLARRWFLDPGSQLLFGAMRAQPDAKDLPTAAEAVAAFGQYLGMPLSLKKLIKLASVRWAWELPPLLWHTVKDPFGFTSLPRTTWDRLLLSRTQTQKHAPKREASREAQDVWLVQRESSAAEDQDVAALDLVKVFNPGPTDLRLDRVMAGRRVSEWITTNESKGPWLTLLGHWALWLMRRDKGHGKKLQPTSVKRYLSAVARPLIGLVHDVDPHLVDEEDLEQKLAGFSKLFRTSAARRFNVARLWCFLSWAHRFAGLALPDLPDLDSADVDGRPRPRANLLTPLEYAAAYNSLQTLAADPRQRNMLRLMLALCYRCGLRWGTVWKLTRNQVTSDCAFLLVGPNRYNKGKSDADRRWVPLRDLLHVKEHAALVAWIRQVDAECPTLGGGFLMFHERGSPHTVLPSPRCHDLLLELIREVSGDSTMRIHDLRHSALSFFMLRLFSRDGYPALSELLPVTWTGVDQELARGDDGFAIALALTKDRVPTRALGYLLSMLAGHASAETTIHHYCHLLDWWLFHYSRQRSPVVPNALSSILLGIPADHVRRSAAKRYKMRGRGRLSLAQVADRIAMSPSSYGPPMRRIRLEALPPLFQEAAPKGKVRDVADAGFAEALSVVIACWSDPAKASRGHGGFKGIRLAKLTRLLEGVLAVNPQLKEAMQEMPDPRFISSCDKAYRALVQLLTSDADLSNRLHLALKSSSFDGKALSVVGEPSASAIITALVEAGTAAKRIKVVVSLSRPKRHDHDAKKWAARLGRKTLDVQFGPRSRNGDDHRLQIAADTTSPDLKAGLGAWLNVVLVLAACVAQTVSTGSKS